MILQIFLTKMAITQPRKVQIPKFWCLKSSTNIWQSCGNIYSIPKINKIELRGENGSKLAKIGQFFALKKLKLNFLKNFPGFYFKSFLCVFLYVSMNFSHWQNLRHAIPGTQPPQAPWVHSQVCGGYNYLRRGNTLSSWIVL